MYVTMYVCFNLYSDIMTSCNVFKVLYETLNRLAGQNTKKFYLINKHHYIQGCSR